MGYQFVHFRPVGKPSIYIDLVLILGRAYSIDDNGQQTYIFFGIETVYSPNFVIKEIKPEFLKGSDCHFWACSISNDLKHQTRTNITLGPYLSLC